MKKQEAEIRIEELRRLLDKWSKAYYINDDPIVEDSVFDSANNELKELESKFPELITKDSNTMKVGASIESSSFEKTRHEIKMLSLDNAFNEEQLIQFDNRVSKEVSNYTFYVEPKIDGLSISLIYQNGKLVKAITRGDGQIGENVTNNALQVSSIPREIDYKEDITVRGEIFISDKSFEQVNKIREENGDQLFANPRNAASGSMRQLDPLVVKERSLDMIAYFAMRDEDSHSFNSQEETISSLSKLGFRVSKHSKHVNNINEVIKYISWLTEKKNSIGYEIDGIVVKVNESSLYTEIGYTTKFPKWAIAYKFPEELKETKLLNIFPTIGRTGRVTYNALLEEVELAGTKVQRATLHNADYIKDLDLRVNDIVKVKKAGEIIPKVVSSNKEFRKGNEIKWEEETNCPTCGSSFERNEGEVDQYCNNESCPSRLIESINHFVSRDAMNIDGLSIKQIEKFIELGFVKSFSDIYKLYNRREEIIDLEGYQSKSVDSLLESIEKSKSNGLDKLLFGLGIRHVGKKTARDIANNYLSIDNIINIDYESLLDSDDLGEVKSKSIVDYFKKEKHIKEIEELKSLGINPTFKRMEVDASHPLNGKKVVVTGTIEGFNRNEVKLKLESYGANVVSTVSNSIDYLIIGEKASSAKLGKVDSSKIIKFIDIDKLGV